MVQLPESGLFVGIDIGTGKNVGWAIVDMQAKLIESGVIELDTKVKLEKRFPQLRSLLYGDVICNVTRRVYNWDEFRAVGIETPYVGKNIQTALKLGKTWGISAGPFIEAGFIPYSIYPSTAKKALTGSGKATKYGMVVAAHQMGMAATTNDKDELVGNDNEADAIGVALAAREQWMEEYFADSIES